MNQHLRKLLIFAVVAIIGFLLLKLSTSLVKEGTVQRYKTLCANVDSTTAFLNETAEVYTVQRRTLKANLYKYSYTYAVKGREYVVEKSSLSEKPDLELAIWFNKNNPEQNEFEDPCVWMAQNGNRFVVSPWVDNVLFALGIGMLLYGGWKTLASLFRLILSAFVKEPPKDQQAQ